LFSPQTGTLFHCPVYVCMCVHARSGTYVCSGLNFTWKGKHTMFVTLSLAYFFQCDEVTGIFIVY
jgi:hypothetical protein